MNMKWLINLSRVAILTACAIWLMTRTPEVRAQIMNCYTYNTENTEVCQGCCSAVVEGTNVIVTPDGPGIQVPITVPINCGSCTSTCAGGAGCSVCGAQSYTQAVVDSDCCLPSGFPCNQGTCCNGLICLSRVTCGTCRTTGQTCGVNSDCCSGNCSGGKCLKCPVGCTQVGNSCSCCPIILDTTGRASNLLMSRTAYISDGNQTDPHMRCHGPMLLAGTAGSSCQT
jgi:hypothetical protein